jgi:hypothetical protein
MPNAHKPLSELWVGIVTQYKRIEAWGKERPLAVAVIFLGVTALVSWGTYEAGYAAGWSVAQSKYVVDMNNKLQSAAVQAAVRQQCQQQIDEARKTGCAASNFLQWYGDKMDELSRRAAKLLDKPDAKDQQLLNQEIEDTIQAGEDARARFGEIADALDGEAADVRNLIRKQESAADINSRIIGLAQKFAGKKAELQVALQSIVPNAKGNLQTP